MQAPRYVRWLIEETNIQLTDGTHIPCYRLDHTKDEDILNEWALHLRRHYESDESLAESIAETGLPASEYLRDYVLPGTQNLAAACRSGDFTEILVSDLLEFIHGYKVPRCKQQNRANKDRSTQGTDIVGYHYANPDGTASTRDELVAAEVKGLLSSSSYDVLEKAAVDSQEDEFRLATTLNFYRKQLKGIGNHEEAKRIARFLQKSEAQYHIRYLGVGVASISQIENDLIPDYSSDDLMLSTGHEIFLLHGEKLMALAHDLYARCMR